jgi:hypothetical protein
MPKKQLNSYNCSENRRSEVNSIQAKKYSTLAVGIMNDHRGKVAKNAAKIAENRNSCPGDVD